ncbi:MAG: hypothetical protein WA958_02520 [Tunicatimonas sp.]
MPTPSTLAPSVELPPTATPASNSPEHRIPAEAENLVRTHVLSVLREAIDEQRALVRAVEELVKEKYPPLAEAQRAEDQSAFFRAYTEYNQAVYALIEHRYENNTARAYEEVFATFAAEADQLVQGLPLMYQAQQSEDRFTAHPGERPLLRVVKSVKRYHRAIAQGPTRVANSFRKLLRRAPRPVRPRSYRVPLRHLTQYWYREAWIAHLVPVVELIYQRTAANTLRLWRFEDEVYTRWYKHLIENYAQQDDWLAHLPELPQDAYETTVAELLEDLNDLEQAVVSEVESCLTTTHEHFTHAYERVGTAELSARRYGGRALYRRRRQGTQKFAACTQGWRNTLYALYEDWRIDQGINLLCTTLFNEHTHLRSSLHNKIDEATLPQLDRLIDCIGGVEQAVRESSEAQLPQALQQQQDVVDHTLIRVIIPSTVAVLYRQSLPAAVLEVYKRIQAAVDTVADRRALVDTNDYDRPLRAAELNYVSPRQIVSFESLPKLRLTIEATKEETGQRVLQIQKMITEIGQVSYFNLDSARSLYETEAEEAAEKARTTAEEGLQRAIKSAEGVQEQIRTAGQEVDSAVWQAIRDFNSNLVALKSNDYALEIKLRIAKAKALERTQTLKRQSLDYLKHGIPYLARYGQQRYTALNEAVNGYRQQFGLASAAATVTTEVSDFLNDTEVAVNRLPYVYQRLYSNRPLEDAVFYEERTAETALLQKAYHNWARQRYASTMLVGEKGTGATTLINFFLKKIPTVELERYEIIRVDATSRCYTEIDLLKRISALVPDITFTHLDEAVAYFNEHPRKHIIVWEDIQHCYLRKVGGFVALKLLFELISRTHKQVFWLCACTCYAWDFLNKTTHISDYFEYIIPLENISSEQLQEAILKRHRVSGYHIQYTGAVAGRLRKKFQKMTTDQKQQHLEKVYFEDMNQLTAGNYSVAQLYWLRSTQQVLNDTITIGSLDAVDFSFTKSIPLQQMLTLHALLLHDGLSEAHFQEVNEHHAGRRPVATQLGLRQLRDDGLVTLKDEVYTVNPLLYRQIVQLLRSKNFLH